MSPDLYGILGRPVGHSISPAFHNRAFALKGVPGIYCAWEKQEEELPDFFHAVRTLPIAGLSVTIPYKSKAAPFLDELTNRARLTGAVNTVFRRDDRLAGGNTDVDGLLMPLARRAGPPLREALILGAGGVARAVAAGLTELGLSLIAVAARDKDKAEKLLAAFSFGKEASGPCPERPEGDREGHASRADSPVTPAYRALAWEERVYALADMGVPLVINATPLGMQGAFEDRSPLPDEAFDLCARRMRRSSGDARSDTNRPVFFDLVYAPRETRFLAAARAHGFECIDGLAFFAAQAVGQFTAWTGKEFTLQEAEQILETLPDSSRLGCRQHSGAGEALSGIPLP
ncbi:MAG: shikimate dehydrogenase [Desulfovibrio sp.]|jgi:shikimate dehydrogenase|nr:shikimate dehydrogenase [Desulfovibrio sp.]